MPISEDAQAAIKELREQGCSKTSVSEVLGVDVGTVSRYDPEGAETEDDAPDPRTDDLGALVSPDVPVAEVFEEEFVDDVYLEAQEDTLADVVDGDTENVPLSDMDFTELSPGEFIEEYFDSLGAGVKSKFVTLIGRAADRRGKIPNRDKLASDLSDMSSGVSSPAEIQYIADDYWDVAQRYMREAQVGLEGDGSVDSPGGQQTRGGAGGQMVSPGGQQSGGGQWVQLPTGEMRYGQFQQGPNGAQTFVPMQPPNGGMGPGQAGGGAGGRSDEIEALREELREIREAASGGGGDGSVADQLQELKQLQETAEDVLGGGQGGDEQLRAVQQEIRRLSENLSDGGSAPSGGDPRDQILQQALQRQDLGPEQAMELADRIEGQQDPEVKKAEIEAETEKEKVERRAERTEQFADFASDLVSELGKLARNAAEEDEATDAAAGATTPTAQGQRTQARTANVQPRGDGGAGPAAPRPDGLSQTPDEFDCPECGATTQQDGSTPGVICGECDYSVLPCRACSSPVEVPPVASPGSFACPSCQSQIDVIEGDTENLVCLSCEWMGSAAEAGAEVVACDDCGTTNEVTRDEPAYE
jgi:hypothetical protein